MMLTFNVVTRVFQLPITILVLQSIKSMHPPMIEIETWNTQIFVTTLQATTAMLCSSTVPRACRSSVHFEGACIFVDTVQALKKYAHALVEYNFASKRSVLSVVIICQLLPKHITVEQGDLFCFYLRHAFLKPQ